MGIQKHDYDWNQETPKRDFETDTEAVIAN